MTNWAVYALGFTAQLLFSGRVILQWVLSEKKRKIFVPVLFWQLSLLGSFLLFLYGYFRNDLPIMLGQALTYFIYIRNLQLQKKWSHLPVVFRGFLLLFPAAIILGAHHNQQYDLHILLSNDQIPLWLMIWGITAQVVFTLRFVYQWLSSERSKESRLPMGFWVLSLLGSAMILIYAIFRRDPVLLAGHALGSLMYGRNIFIHRNEIKE